MSPLAFVAVALAGGLGAVCRFVLDAWVNARWPLSVSGSTVKLGTFAMNVTGSLALGIVTGLTTRYAVDSQMTLVIGTGFMGGYTTFSTAMWDALSLGRDEQRHDGASRDEPRSQGFVLLKALAHAGIMAGSCILAAGLGILATR